MIGVIDPIVQINHSLSVRKGTVRGLHFQRPPHAEIKIVTCVRGRVFDVAVDVRKHSPTFLRWHGIELSDANMDAFLIPPGFAHGFQTLENNCELIYLHTRAYAPCAEDGLRVDDPSIRIDWPLPVRNLSKRDLGFELVKGSFEGIEL
jgi:dTDP-4-dehydrorhamnose 3,5-epimerase